MAQDVIWKGPFLSHLFLESLQLMKKKARLELESYWQPDDFTCNSINFSNL